MSWTLQHILGLCADVWSIVAAEMNPTKEENQPDSVFSDGLGLVL